MVICGFLSFASRRDGKAAWIGFAEILGDFGRFWEILGVNPRNSRLNSSWIGLIPRNHEIFWEKNIEKVLQIVFVFVIIALWYIGEGRYRAIKGACRLGKDLRF